MEIKMKYIDVLNLVNLALENEILHQQNGHVIVYMTLEDGRNDWCLVDKEYAVQSLMRDEDGLSAIIAKLQEKGIEFKPKYS